MKKTALTIVTLAAALQWGLARAGPLDPDCTAEKAAKSAATKAAVGVGGHCSPAEAVKDTAKDAAGLEEKRPIEKLKDDGKATDKAADKATDKATHATKGAVKKVTK